MKKVAQPDCCEREKQHKNREYEETFARMDGIGSKEQYDGCHNVLCNGDFEERRHEKERQERAQQKHKPFPQKALYF